MPLDKFHKFKSLEKFEENTVRGLCGFKKVIWVGYFEFFPWVMALVKPRRLSLVISVSLLSNFSSDLSISVLVMNTFSVVSIDVVNTM